MHMYIIVFHNSLLETHSMLASCAMTVLFYCCCCLISQEHDSGIVLCKTVIVDHE